MQNINLIRNPILKSILISLSKYKETNPLEYDNCILDFKIYPKYGYIKREEISIFISSRILNIDEKYMTAINLREVGNRYIRFLVSCYDITNVINNNTNLNLTEHQYIFKQNFNNKTGFFVKYGLDDLKRTIREYYKSNDKFKQCIDLCIKIGFMRKVETKKSFKFQIVIPKEET